MSRIGVKPIEIPSSVKVKLENSAIFVEGSKGKLNMNFSDRVSVEVKDNKIIVTRATDSKKDKTFHGLTRALIANMVKGVSEGFKKELEIIGVGFKAQLQGKNLNLSLGYSHPVNVEIPEGVKVQVPKPTQIVVEGIDKAQVGQVAANIRAAYPPEPYKGKGIRYVDEYVKRKAGKAAAK